MKLAILSVQNLALTNPFTMFLGECRDFGLYTDSVASYGSHMFYYFWDVPIFCAMGAIGGLMGALWVHVNVKITAFRHKRIPVRSPIKRLLEVLLLVLLTSSVWFFISYASPCRALPSPVTTTPSPLLLCLYLCFFSKSFSLKSTYQ